MSPPQHRNGVWQKVAAIFVGIGIFVGVAGQLVRHEFEKVANDIEAARQRAREEHDLLRRQHQADIEYLRGLLRKHIVSASDEGEAHADLRERLRALEREVFGKEGGG